jgi:hypothetical protein
VAPKSTNTVVAASFPGRAAHSECDRNVPRYACGVVFSRWAK